MTADQVGEILHVTAARVRQLAAERKIPRPLTFGPRANLWQRSAIEICQTRLASPRKQTTRQSGLLDDVTAPLHRTNDVILPLDIRGASSEVHVRIWQGDAMEGQRTVVVMSRPIGHPYADVNIERIVETIDDQFLAGRGGHALWFEAYLDEAGGRGPRFSLANVVFVHGRPERRSWNSSRYQSPVWIEHEIAEIDRVTGTAVEWWPPAAYTAAEIVRWQRDGDLLTVEDDRYELVPLEQALRTLRRIGPDDDQYDLAQHAITYIASDMADKDQLYDLPWDDGTVSPNAEAWPTRFAARLIPHRLDDEARDLVFTIGRGNAAADLDIQALNDDLLAWLRNVDEFGDKSNLQLAAAARTILLTLERNEDELSEPAQDPVPRLFDIAGPNDRKFLEALTWVTGEDIDRDRRQLHHEIGVSEDIEYATAPGGNLVARSPGGDVFVVMWPTRGDTALTATRSLIGDRSTGDRPIYVEEDGKVVGLLNLGPHHFRDWTWGYPSGVDSLASAIIHHVNDEHPSAQVPRAWIEDLLGYSTDPSLRIEIGDILRRSKATARS